MGKPKQEVYIFFQSSRFQVEFYYTRDGKLPAREYFDKADRKVKLKLIALVELLTEKGTLYDKTKYRIVDSNERIFEFKPLHDRFFNFFHKGGKIVLTNAYRKQSQKLDRKALAKAIEIKKDYERRVKEGSYYEKKN